MNDTSRYPRRKSIDCIIDSSLVSELMNKDSYERNAAVDRQEMVNMLSNFKNKEKLQSELQNVQLHVKFLERELGKAKEVNAATPAQDAVNQHSLA